jgi:asparagine synthase (glutamine-hydrolysing)
LSRIAGIDRPLRQADVAAALSILRRPGASEPRFWSGSRATLGAIGLSRLNHFAGPAVSPDATAALVLDGRLANAGTLAARAPGGSTPQRQAALALALIRHEGTQALHRMEGSFALAFADGRGLVLARDRLGIRPLYYGFHHGALHFASEIKALLERVERVHEFPPGHALLPGRGFVPLAALAPEPLEFADPLESARQVRQALDQAVERALDGGDGVGVWLSGGVDSSAVAASARARVERLLTFSAGVAGSPDLAFARQVARHLDTLHFERVYSLDDVLDVIEQVIYQLESFDAPLVRSAVANHLVAGLASEHVGHVLSGEGGDELFAGYAYQRDCDPGLELTLSVQDAVGQLHHTALQRVDRAAAAHATRADVPLLDPQVVRLAMAIPSGWKINGQAPMEKWPLRKACEGRLPEAVVWRAKAKFWEGAGAATLLSDHAEDSISDPAFAAERILGDAPPLRSKEELLYYRIFRQAFGGHVPLAEVGRTAHI